MLNSNLIKKLRISTVLLIFIITHFKTFLTVNSLVLYLFLHEIKATKFLNAAKNLIIVNSILGPFNSDDFIRTNFYITKDFKPIFSYNTQLLIDGFLHLLPLILLSPPLKNIIKNITVLNNKDRLFNILFTYVYTLSHLSTCFLSSSKLSLIKGLYHVNMSEIKTLFILHNISSTILNIIY